MKYRIKENNNGRRNWFYVEYKYKFWFWICPKYFGGGGSNYFSELVSAEEAVEQEKKSYFGKVIKTY